MLVVVNPRKTENPSIGKIKSKINTARKELLKAEKDLAHWKSVPDTYSQLFRKHIKPELLRLNKVRKAWILKLFEARSTMKWSKNEKALLDEEIVTKAIDLLDEIPGDPELESIIQKYHNTHQTLAEEENFESDDESFLQMLAEDICIESNLPKDFFNGCTSEQAMYDRFSQYMNEKKETKRAQYQPSEKPFVTGIIKSLYRRLASLLHPDKEFDPIKKQAKTELMQRLNNAYGKNDIDELMLIQKEANLIRPVDLMSDIDGLTANLKSIKKQYKDLTKEANEIKKWFKTQIHTNLVVEDVKKIEPHIRNSFKVQVISIQHEIIQLESDINYRFNDRKGIKNRLQY